MILGMSNKRKTYPKQQPWKWGVKTFHEDTDLLQQKMDRVKVERQY